MGRINVTFTIFEELMLELSKEVEEGERRMRREWKASTKGRGKECVR